MKLDAYLSRAKKELTVFTNGIVAYRKRQTNSFGTALRKMGDRLKKYGAKAKEYKDAVGYYAVLAIVLVALSAAAYDYRGKKNERAVIDANIEPDFGVTVQMHTDPTMSPEFVTSEFILPVNGKLITEFADDELIWSTTMQLWQTHPALDISSSVGEAVVAVADGVVQEAYSDALLGKTIVIDHGEGRVVKYASLNTLEMVQVGQKVRQGDIIASVGVCLAESELGAHIHLEYMQKDHKEDFSLLLSESDLENLRD